MTSTVRHLGVPARPATPARPDRPALARLGRGIRTAGRFTGNLALATASVLVLGPDVEH